MDIAIAGARGHVEKFVKLINQHENFQVTKLWDENVQRGEEIAEKCGCTYVNDYQQILEDDSIAGVVILAENCYHKQLVIKAAKAKKHVFLEKPLAVSYQDGVEMRNAVIENNVHFFLTDPFVRPQIVYCKQLLQEGKIGEVTSVYLRVAHTMGLDEFHPVKKYLLGTKMNGGVMADIGHHGLHILYYLFGCCTNVTSFFDSLHAEAKEYNYEEKAISIFKYPDKMVTLECTTVGLPCSFHLNIYGTKGNIVLSTQGEKNSFVLKVQTGKEDYTSVLNEYLPESAMVHVDYWIHSIVDNISNEQIAADPMANNGLSIDDALQCARMIDAIYQHHTWLK